MPARKFTLTANLPACGSPGPFELDVTEFVQPGDNRIEILVYNTLSNHYQTIPTPPRYKETTTSGLIGPVQLIQER